MPISTPHRTHRGPVLGGAIVVAALLLGGCSQGFDEHAANHQPQATSPTTQTTTPMGSATPSSPVADPTGAAPSPTSDPTGEPTEKSSAAPVGTAKGSVRVLRDVTDDIDVPWGLAELPDGTVLVTSRDDFHLYRLVPSTGRRTDLGTIPGVSSNVAEGGEGGLLGVAVAPTFATDHRIYLYWSTTVDNRIGYVDLRHHHLTEPTVIVSGIPHSIHHNGGRLAFGPDGYLYASTGEAEVPSRAQDESSLGGKILRMRPNGRPAPGNPFGTLVFSYGHRNVQGLAFDATGHLFASEFGDHDYDELNWIRAGHNYGWPQSQGTTTLRGITGPITEFGTEEDSPSGIAIANGSVWMAALQGERLWRIPLDGTHLVTQPTSFLDGTDGRLRSVLALGEHTLLVTTSNRDGRTTPRAGDDRILMLRVS